MKINIIKVRHCIPIANIIEMVKNIDKPVFWLLFNIDRLINGLRWSDVVCSFDWCCWFNEDSVDCLISVFINGDDDAGVWSFILFWISLCILL